MTQLHASRGFTLIELLVTSAIIAVLATIAYPLMHLEMQRAKEKELRIALRQIRSALDAYKQASDEGRIERRAEQSGYPPTLADLLEAGQDKKVVDSVRALRFLRAIPRDPMAPPELSAEKSWGLREYSSSHNEPREGADVYDVYSRSDKVGLNGIPYRQW